MYVYDNHRSPILKFPKHEIPGHVHTHHSISLQYGFILNCKTVDK